MDIEGKEKKRKEAAKKALQKAAGREIKDLGLDDNALARTFAGAAAIASGKVRGKLRLDDETSLKGEIDAKKKKIKLSLDKEF